MSKKILRVVRFITLAALISLIVIYTIVYLQWWGITLFVFAFLAFGIALVFPVVGGVFMLILGIPAFYNLYDSNYDFQIKLPAYILILIFITSGFIHIATSFRWKKRKTKQGV